MDMAELKFLLPDNTKNSQAVDRIDNYNGISLPENRRVLIVFQVPKNISLYANTLPPLGLLGIASFLEHFGFEVDVRDCYVQNMDDIDFSKYGAICFSINVANIVNTMETIEKVKLSNPNAKIFAGGGILMSDAEYYMNKYHEIDAIVVGDAEFTLLELMLDRKKEGIKGLIIRDEKEKPFFTGARSRVFYLDELPFPALGKVPLKKYDVPIKKASPISNIVTSRGCPEKCIFCYHDAVWRQRGAKHVVDEIEWQVNKLGIKEICFNDDNFTLNRERAIEICNMIIERGIKFKWQLKNGIRADKCDYELLKKMRDAGLWLVSFAPETGSNESLKKIRKNFTIEDVGNCVKWCKELGINTFAFFILGFPWETKEDMENTIKFALKLNTDFAQFTRVYPIEGTELYEKYGIRPLKKREEEVAWHSGGAQHNSYLVSNEEISKLVKKAFRSFYLRPGKIINLMRILSPKDIYHLVKYAKASSSM